MNMTVAILSISGLPQFADLTSSVGLPCLTESAACLTVLTRIPRGKCDRVLLTAAIACLKLVLAQDTVRTFV
jgi:hypothetical protein